MALNMNSTSSFFDARASVYDTLRPQDGAWWRRFEALVREGDLRGRRVLDIGCGTGALAAALVERESARVWVSTRARRCSPWPAPDGCAGWD